MKSLKHGDETQPSPEPDLRESVEWYRANHRRLLKRHRDEYVAILERKVVDHDANFESLAVRVFARWGVKPVFMPRVTERIQRVRIRSPRRKRT